MLAYYTLEKKSSEACEYQPVELDDNLIENNHEEGSCDPKTKLMISGKRMWCCKVRQILWYHKLIIFYIQKNFLIICCFCFFFFVQRWKTITIRLFTIVSKETARTRIPGCCKQEQNNWTIWWFSWSTFFSV